MPLHFTINQGQFDDKVKFHSRGVGYDLFLTSSEAVLTLSKPAARHKTDTQAADLPEAGDAQSHKQERAVLRMKLAGANRSPKVEGLEQLSGASNYLVGNEPSRWRTGVANYARIKYTQVYPGVDLIYYGNQQQLEYDFIVAPGADPAAITIDFKGADKAQLNAEGDLVLETTGAYV